MCLRCVLAWVLSLLDCWGWVLTLACCMVLGVFFKYCFIWLFCSVYDVALGLSGVLGCGLG